MDIKKVDHIKLVYTVLLIIFTATVFLAIGFWAGTGNKTSSTIPTPPVPPVPTLSANPSVTFTATADATASWKTYTNETYGFSFKYPNDWTFSESSSSAAYPLQLLVSSQSTINSEAGPSTTIIVSNNRASDIIDTDVARYSSYSGYSKTDSKFAGESATTISYKDTNDSNKEIIIIPKNDRVYVLSGIANDAVKVGGEDLGQFANISSTFQFISAK
jgi:hypothetical protein